MLGRYGRVFAAFGGLVASTLVLLIGPSSYGQQPRDDDAQQRQTQQQPANDAKAGAPAVNAPVVKGKASDQTAKETKDDPRDPPLIRALKFFDRHNGAFNAFAAIAVAIFTWRLWRLSVKEVNALGQQSKDVERSIAEAARAANAMENVAEAMGRSATTVEENMKLLKERTAQQMRAYVTVLVGVGIYQERDKGLRFEGKPILLNTGATPAHKLQYRGGAAVMDLDAVEDFKYPLSEQVFGGATLNSQQSFSASVVLPDYIPDQDVGSVMAAAGRVFLIWGVVTYEDIFGDKHETRFSIIYQWWLDANNAPQVNGRYTRGHNEAN